MDGIPAQEAVPPFKKGIHVRASCRTRSGIQEKTGCRSKSGMTRLLMLDDFPTLVKIKCTDLYLSWQNRKVN